MKQKARGFLVIFLFFIVLSYLSGITNKTRKEGISWMNLEQIETQEESCFVEYEDKLSTQKIPLEEFLVGALAATVDVEYDSEVLKAQAVLLRSTYYAKLREQSTVSGQMTDNYQVDWQDVSSGYLTQAQMKKVWRENYEENYTKAFLAVEETRGIIITYREKPVEGIYHAMSAGKTRSAPDTLKNGEYVCLESVTCEKNVESADFLQNTEVSKRELSTLTVEERDEAGYVTLLVCNGESMTGEQFRQKYKLASANFTFEEKEGSFLIETKGIGHGFGMDQYYSNCLAQNDYSYAEILAYFFKDTKLSKINE